MPREFKLSRPLNEPAELGRAAREARQADQLAEFAVMRAFEVYRVHKFGHSKTSASDEVIRRLDRATARLGDAREALGEAVYQFEELLARVGELP